MAPRTITLMGMPTINDVGKALEVITPGYLIEQPVAGVSKQTITSLAAPPIVAMERDELGRGIDDTLGVGEAGAAAYAIGETVKAGTFKPGDRAFLFVASGVTTVADDLLDSAGDGTLQVAVGTVPMCRALDAVTGGVVAADVRMRVEFI